MESRNRKLGGIKQDGKNEVRNMFLVDLTLNREIITLNANGLILKLTE